MSVLSFQKRVERYLNCHLECVVTKNRTTMLSILEKNFFSVRLSVHQMFLEAPEEVIVAIAAYVKQKRWKKTEHNRRIREYIHQQYGNFSHRAPKVNAQGLCYNLQELMNEINQIYFGNGIGVGIGWFKGRSPRRKILFGKYEQSCQLIRLNDCLDNHSVPEFFVRFIIYHEMLHVVIPSYMDDQGRCRMHGPEFKERERRFLEYEKARRWEKENREKFFGRA